MRPPAPDPGSNPWAEYEPYFDAGGLAEFLGTSIDAINQAIADRAVLYLVTADGFALIPASQFPSSDGSLVPLLGEMAALMDPGRSDPAGILIWGLAPQKEQGGRTPVEVLRSGDAEAIARLMETAARIGAPVG